MDSQDIGDQMHAFISDLYPICRSITGNGLRETLRRVAELLPGLVIGEVPSGTRVYDWTVPKEWNIRDAYVKNSRDERIIDFRKSNLHVVGYSVPVRATMKLTDLLPHLHSLPDRPDWIPYKTSYYEEAWGFCLAHSQLTRLPEDEYDVCIDAELKNGHLSYGELCLPGAGRNEVLISCHCCHPSLCNDNLSGVAVATFLARELSDLPLRHSYRFLFIPGTIGSIAWLSMNESIVSRIKHGLVVTCVGDSGVMTYKRSRRGDAEIDRTVEHVLRHSGEPFEVEDFAPYGYDERQYCSPGFDLPVGSLRRTPHGRFPEYHTSGDDLAFVRPEHLADSLSKYLAVIHVLEHNVSYVSRNQKCEPQLGRRGLYQSMAEPPQGAPDPMAMLWVLNLSDGRHSLLDIADRAGIEFGVIKRAADALLTSELLKLASE